MRLLERYALAVGLKIGKQHLLEQFFPLPFTKYITLHASSGMAGKNYPYYPTVVELIKPYLAERGIEIVQMGAKDDIPVPGCHHIMGRDNVHQASYLIRNALLHLGNDSVWGHRAGHLGIPLVQPWGPTDPANHSSLEADPAKTRHLVSHRWGRNPTFAAQENPLSIALVCPYSIARAMLELLGIPNTLTQKTLNVGPVFIPSMLELVPNCVPGPDYNPQIPMVVRFDLAPNEGVLAQVLQTGRKVNVLTKTPINLSLIQQAKPLILSLSYEVDETTPVDYVAALKKLYPATSFFTRSLDAAYLAALRFRFFDVVTVQQVIDRTRADFERAVREYINDPAFSLDSTLKTDTLEFKTNKYVLSNGKTYLSQAHEKADRPVGTAGFNTVVDDELFWCDSNHWLVYRV